MITVCAAIVCCTCMSVAGKASAAGEHYCAVYEKICTITGKVTQKETGEPVIGAGIFIEQLGKGTVTDIDGNYTLAGIKEGVYTIKAECMTFKMALLKDVEIKTGSDGSALRLDIVMEEDINQLGEVIVQSVKRQNSQLSAVNAVRYSSVVMNAVSSGEISKTPDKNAAEIVRRVPGVSISEDRYIIVRGLPQRYNNVWLNNSTVPGSEPDTRSFSFDMVPTSQIENIMIVKSPSAELPAEFTGGFLKIQSKNIPDKNSVSANYTDGYNSATHFDDFMKISGSKWSVEKKTPFLDQKGGVELNRAFRFGSGAIGGITAAAEYSYTPRIISDMENSRYGVYNIAEDKPEYMYDYTDNIWQQTSRTGVLLNTAYIKGRSKLLFRNLFNRTEIDKYTVREGWQNISSKYVQQKYEYVGSTRTIYTGQLSGEHLFGENEPDLGQQRSRLDWNLSYSYASKDEPDRRIINREENTFVGDAYYGYMGIDQNEITIDNTNLVEHIGTVGVNYNYRLGNGQQSLFGRAELRAGLYGEYRSRKYNAKSGAYRFNQSNLPSDFKYRDVVDEILIEENMGPDKLYLYDDTDNRDSYKGRDFLGAAYLQIYIPAGDFKINAGARFEARDMVLTNYISMTNRNTEDHSYTKYNVFPSLNVSYSLTDSHLLRVAYGMSANRQEFLEVSPSVYYDFSLFSNVKGNPELKQAMIQNIDLRYEFYTSVNEYISVALFYKHFKNPIEWTYLDAGGSYTYTFENAEGANNYGVEVDVKKTLDFIGLKNFTLGFNASLIESKVTFNKETSLERDRPMQGQSPYLVNASLFYEIPGAGMQIGALYNRIGKRIVGIGRVDTSSGATINNDVPDTYELPRDMLDFAIAKSVGKHVTLKANVKDVLDYSVKFVQYPRFYDNNGTLQKRMQVCKQFKMGVSASLGVQVTF